MTVTKKKKTPSTELSFEEALASLEGIIGRLEGDDLTLDRSLEYFEEGVRLMRRCERHLKDVRGKLMGLTKGDDGEFITEIFGESLESFTGGGDKGDLDG